MGRTVTSPKDTVMMKRGAFYRPDRAGYTSNILEAGAYDREFAADYCDGRTEQRFDYPSFHEAGSFFNDFHRLHLSLLSAAKELVEASESMALHFQRPDETGNERFERVAEAFYKDTGSMAPGKDVPLAMASSPPSDAGRMAVFDKWVDAKLARVTEALASTKAAIGEE